MNWEDQSFHLQDHTPAKPVPPWQRPGKGHKPASVPAKRKLSGATVFGLTCALALVSACVWCWHHSVPY